jgi:hypothetical protein
LRGLWYDTCGVERKQLTERGVVMRISQMKLPVQLAKGGKHTFGWSVVTDSGVIAIPPEAVVEYGLADGDRLIVVPGSRTSGGFGLTVRESIGGSILGVVLEEHAGLREYRVPAGHVIQHHGRPYCWVRFLHGTITLAEQTLARYGVRIGDRLLVIRGSGLALGFAVRGPIVQEAMRYGKLPVCENKG